jgi:hypothetical protein
VEFPNAVKEFAAKEKLEIVKVRNFAREFFPLRSASFAGQVGAFLQLFLPKCACPTEALAKVGFELFS